MSADATKLLDAERTGIVVVHVQLEPAARRVDAFDVMPGVRRHEELSAVLRIVIAMRPRRVLDLRLRAVFAGSGLQLVRLPRARPSDRHGHVHELPAANRATTGMIRRDDGVDRAAPDTLE